MIELIWDLYQQKRISEASSEAAEAKLEAGQHTARIRELERALHRTLLINQALWELIRGRLDLTDADLIAKMSEIDLRDGVRDERMTPRPTRCPACDRLFSGKHVQCIYCGTAVPRQHLYQ